MSAEAGEPVGARFLGGHDRVLLSRIEDAGLNASAPPQQRWMDGWLVRTSPGKAQRARCINAVAGGCRPVGAKLAECEALYRSLGLPLLVRITPFSRPPDLDRILAGAGCAFHEDTRVMLLPKLQLPAIEHDDPPQGADWAEVTPQIYAEAVGDLRGSPAAARHAHAERLRASPVPYRGFVLARDGAVIACGQIAPEGEVVGLYDIATHPQHQGRGLARWLSKRLLTVAVTQHQSTVAYLQVGAGNEAARRVYTSIGFADAYSYHYRIQPTAG